MLITLKVSLLWLFQCSIQNSVGQVALVSNSQHSTGKNICIWHILEVHTIHKIQMKIVIGTETLGVVTLEWLYTMSCTMRPREKKIVSSPYDKNGLELDNLGGEEAVFIPNLLFLKISYLLFFLVCKIELHWKELVNCRNKKHIWLSFLT